jgi:ABC-2 type transport system ATP-binding protein
VSNNESLQARDDLAVQTRGLTKQFDETLAVDDLTFYVPRGIIFGLIGPSGCGKTTTVRLLTGVHSPTSGEVLVLGQHPTEFSQKTRARIGYMLQQSVLYQDLTVWENINFASAIYGVGPVRGKQLNQALDFVELQEHRRKAVKNISGGMRRRLSLASTLVHNPALIFLDEPTTGIDPVLRRKFWDHFEALRDRGRTLVVTTQYVGEAAYCDRVAVMEAGRLLLVDTPEGLRRTAFGGDVVHLRAAHPLNADLVRDLHSRRLVHRANLVNDRTLRLIVDEASTATPRLMEWAQAQAIDVESLEEHLPPFDDVFVELIEKKRETETTDA